MLTKAHLPSRVNSVWAVNLPGPSVVPVCKIRETVLRAVSQSVRGNESGVSGFNFTLIPVIYSYLDLSNKLTTRLKT